MITTSCEKCPRVAALQYAGDSPNLRKADEMPHETIRETTGLYQKFHGVVTSPELFNSVVAIHNDPGFAALEYVIKDYLEVEVFDVGLKTLIDGHALNLGVQRKNARLIVAVVTTDPNIIEPSLIATSYRLDSYPREIFATVAEARQWIARRLEVPV